MFLLSQDVDIWHGIREVCSIVDHNKRPGAPHTADSFGNMHVLLFGAKKIYSSELFIILFLNICVNDFKR